MKRTFLPVMALGIFGLLGCENKSPPGGPGATGTARSTTPTPDNAFKVTVPDVSLKQGESKTVKVSATRGTNFDQDIMLDVTGEPQGVKITFDNATLKAGATDVSMTVSAATDAAIGDFTAKLNAKPAKSGSATSADMKIEVKKP